MQKKNLKAHEVIAVIDFKENLHLNMTMEKRPVIIMTNHNEVILIVLFIIKMMIIQLFRPSFLIAFPIIWTRILGGHNVLFNIFLQVKNGNNYTFKKYIFGWIMILFIFKLMSSSISCGTWQHHYYNNNNNNNNHFQHLLVNGIILLKVMANRFVMPIFPKFLLHYLFGVNNKIM